MLGDRSLEKMNVEVPENDVGEHAVGLGGVRVLSNPVVGGRAIELRIEQLSLPLAALLDSVQEHLAGPGFV